MLLPSLALIGCGQNRARQLEIENQTLREELTALRSAPENRYRQGIGMVDAAKYEEACSVFTSIVNEFPTSPLAVNSEEQLERLDSVLEGIRAKREIEEARRQQDERRREEEAKYEPLSDDAANEQWKEFRNHPNEYKGTTTTWLFKVTWKLSDGSFQGWLGSPVADRRVEVCGARVTADVKAHDWVAVTGRFEGISQQGQIVFVPIRILNLGVGE
jgi:hypothetical protein